MKLPNLHNVGKQYQNTVGHICVAIPRQKQSFKIRPYEIFCSCFKLMYFDIVRVSCHSEKLVKINTWSEFPYKYLREHNFFLEAPTPHSSIGNLHARLVGKSFRGEYLNQIAGRDRIGLDSTRHIFIIANRQELYFISVLSDKHLTPNLYDARALHI